MRTYAHFLLSRGHDECFLETLLYYYFKKISCIICYERQAISLAEYYQFKSDEKKVLVHLPVSLAVAEIKGDHTHLLLLSQEAERIFRFDDQSAQEQIAEFNAHPEHYIIEKDLADLKQMIKEIISNPGQSLKHTVKMATVHFQEDTYFDICGDVEVREGHQLLFVHINDVTTRQITLVNATRTSDHLSMLLNRILATTQTCVFWKDKERRFLGANKAFLDYYGFSSLDVILGKTDEDIGWHINPEPFKDDELRIIHNGESTYKVHGTCIAKGQVRDIVASKSPLYMDGQVIGLVGTFDDVTDDYMQREEISKLNNALLNSLKNEEKANAAKADFMARMSHDMRTPLTTIIGLSEQAVENTKNDEDRVIFHQITDASHYLLSLLNDILDVEKFDSGKMRRNDEVVDINHLYHQVEAMIEPTARKKGQKFIVKNDEMPSGPYVKTDERWLTQILINIINNAVKYTPDHGTISWTTHYLKQDDGTIMASFEISDTGVGMSKEFLKHMYEPFTQEMNALSHSETSTGLGLSIVKNAVMMFGGMITCDSELHKGTTFHINIPLEYPTEEELASHHEKKSSFSTNVTVLKDKYALLCEDVAINAAIIQSILNKYEIQCDIASNGRQGIETLQAHPDRYDVILMDIRMPVMDGLSAAKEIRTFNKDIPIVALSANTYKEDIQRSLAAGMNAHIGKPINVKELIETLCSLLA
jgi:PAS domain S-box-containing protein